MIREYETEDEAEGLRLLFLLVICLFIVGLVSGCARVREVPVTVETTHEVKVPVLSPCVNHRPDEVAALREKMTAEEWRSLSTDQREKLLGAQSLDRKAQHDKLTVAVAGCH